MTIEDKQQSHVFQKKVDEKGLLAVGTKGEGLYVILEDPKTKERKVCLDGCSGAAVCSLGHNDPEIISHLNEFALESCYTFPGTYGNYAAENLGDFVCGNSDGAFASALWTGSGSESNENAIKIMRQYHLERGDSKRFKVISRRGAYHGHTIGALSLSSNGGKLPFLPILLSDETQTPKIAECNPYHDMTEGMTEEDYAKFLLEDAEKVFLANDPSTIAGLIVETLGGSTLGTPVPPPGYLEGLRTLCHKYGALFMCDEVMCGLGRCGYPFTFMHPDFGLPKGTGPDMCSVGKTIGSGIVTLAGVLVSQKIVDAFASGTGTIIGAQTYHSHALNCRVGLAVQQKIYRDKLIENVRVVGAKMKQDLKDGLKECKIVGDVRGAGNFLTVEAVKDKITKESFDPSLGICHVLEQKCFDKGVLVMGRSGAAGIKQVSPGKVIQYGDQVTIGPAFTFKEEQATILVNAIIESFKEVEAEYL